jgi:hypothetical protein
MGVDKSYGSGYKNSGQSKASALKPGSKKKTAPAVAKAMAIKSRNAAASPTKNRDKYNPRLVRDIGTGIAAASMVGSLALGASGAPMSAAIGSFGPALTIAQMRRNAEYDIMDKASKVKRGR